MCLTFFEYSSALVAEAPPKRRGAKKFLYSIPDFLIDNFYHAAKADNWS